MAATDAQKEILDKGLTDDDLESEIELVSELVLAATSSDRPLHQDEVDHILGVGPAEITPVVGADS
jgi:hypothetical protein